MRKLSIIAGMAMFLAIALWTFAPGQSFAQRGSTTRVKASAHVAGIVIGKPVRNEHNVVLGTVENVILTDNGCVKYIILSGQFSGARSRLYPVPWNVIARSGPDAIFVDLDPQFLVNAPSFEVNRWPDFAQWDVKVRDFYQKRAQGTAPGQAPGAVRSEEKTKAEPGSRAKQGQWGTPASEGQAPTDVKEKGKTDVGKDRRHKESEMMSQQKTPEPSVRKETDKGKQQPQSQEGGMMKGKPGMMEQKPQMMEQGRSHMEQRSPMMKGGEKPAQTGPSQGAGKVEKGKEGEVAR